MLCQFTFKNFKSYKNETIFDLQATSELSFQDTLLKNNTDKKRFLPVSVLYGPNAGGKSNVLEALSSVIALVIKPVLMFENSPYSIDNFDIDPFLFDDISAIEPTEFEIYFRPNQEYEYRYYVSIANGDITNEALYRKKIGVGSRIVMLFERAENNIELGSSISRRKLNLDVNKQMPYLSFLYINYKLDSIVPAVDWFKRCMIRNYANPNAERHLVMSQNKAFKKKLICLMNEVGINISNFEYIKAPDDYWKIMFEHNVNGKTFSLNITKESDGTKKLFNVLPYILIALTEGRLIVIDELDAKLHPKLLKFIIMLFKNTEINKKNAQLIFTSHDVSTMKSSVFRTDEIWFACKLEDESSDLYSLYEMRDESGNHIRPSASYDKQYLEGRYGADPYFQNLMDWT